MLIYKDLFSDDELCSDTYPTKELDGVMIRVTGKLTTESNNLDGCNFGANASEEAPPEEGTDDGSVSGIDVIIANRLIETGFTKKDYMVYIKKYMKRILDRLEGNKPAEEIEEIKKGLQKQVKSIITEFKEYQFFMGESADEDGMMIPVKYELDGTTPYFFFFKHGLIQEKV